jgi:hypothetical protein
VATCTCICREREGAGDQAQEHGEEREAREMTDRLKGITVTLVTDIREDDAQRIRDAIGMVNGVLSVAPVAGEVAMDYIDIVFDGPPGPAAPRFVEVEDSQGRSINYGEWVQRPDGYWALRIPAPK